MNKLSHADIARIAEKFGLSIEKRKYRMWHCVPHIGKTAIVVDLIVDRGGFAIEKDPAWFPSEINEAYIVDAITNGAVSLGELNKDNRYVFTPWNRRKDYPQGYLTRKVGFEKDGWLDRITCPLDEKPVMETA